MIIWLWFWVLGVRDRLRGKHKPSAACLALRRYECGRALMEASDYRIQAGERLMLMRMADQIDRDIIGDEPLGLDPETVAAIAEAERHLEAARQGMID